MRSDRPFLLLVELLIACGISFVGLYFFLSAMAETSTLGIN
jgi:hypothetical protein